MTDYILNTSIDLINNLVFDRKAIERNLNLSGGKIMTEKLMVTLVEKGLGRQEAHELLRTITMESYGKDISFRDLVMKNKEVRKYLDEKEIDDCVKSRQLHRHSSCSGRECNKTDKLKGKTCSTGHGLHRI